MFRACLAFLVVIALLAPSAAEAQKRKRKRKPAPAAADAPALAEEKEKKDAKVFDFTGLQLGGRLRTPQLLYFLDRAEEELDRAALERRSFIPEMARSLDEERL